MTALPGVMTSTSYLPPETMTYEEWTTKLGLIRDISAQHMWWLGDALNWGSHRWGEKYSQALAATDYDYDTLARAAYVCRRIPAERRRRDLSFNHHREVAGMEEPDQERWLDRCEQETLSVHGLRAARRQKVQAPSPKDEDDVSLVPVEILRIFRLMPAEALAIFKRALDDPTGSTYMDTVALPDGRTAGITLSVTISGDVAGIQSDGQINAS